MDYIHLNVKSGYSFFNSTLRIDDLLNTNKEFICLTDNSNLFLALELFKKNKDKKIVLGMEVNIINKDLNINPLVLIAKKLNGYKTLCKLTRNISSSSNKYLSIEDLKKFNDDIICILPTVRHHNFLDYVKEYSQIFKEFYLGLEYYSNNDLNVINLVRTLPYKRVVLSNDKCKKNDLNSLKILKCIENSTTFDELRIDNNFTYFDDESYLSVFNNDEIVETYNIANNSYFNIFDLKGHLYDIKIDDKINYFKALCFKGLKKRNCYNDKYISRLNYELDIIIKMGFTNYFLVVQDYVRYAKMHNILVGPGRGSAASSLVSFCLGITNVDPLKYNLLFERFLNPERVTMPDIDLDFVDEKREEIINYLIDKYGFEHVSHVIAFQTFGARQAIRDVSKVYGLSLIEVDMISKKIPSINKDDTLENIYNNFYTFKAFINSKDIYKQIFNEAKKIEGLPRQTTLHAAGIIINDEPLYEVCPVYLSNNTLVTQYSKDYIEDIGLLKMDILALKNLTTIEDTLKLINEEVILDESILEDKNIYKVISSTLTSGIFQLESAGMKNAIRIIKPNCFNDVVALLALFRPGPMDNIKDYASYKNKIKKVNYIDNSLKDILDETYGIIVYQEQIMQILQKMANFSLGKADLVRRAISKKNEELLKSIKEEFISCSMKNNYSYETSNKVFELIYKFANYGFNKAHSVSYSMISCQMAYLKYYYRVPFFTALLNNSLGNLSSLSKLYDYIYEINQLKIKLLLPDINESSLEFKIKDNAILFALSSINGLNNIVVSNIIKEREKGKFTSFLDFLVRMNKYNLTLNVINTLINSGCFDSLVYKENDKIYSREALRNAVEVSLHYASMVEDKDQLQYRDFISKPEIEEVFNDEYRNFNLEYSTLGISITPSPIFKKKDKTYSSLNKLKVGYNKILCCVVSFKVIKTKKGSYMGISTVFDDTSFNEVVLFDDVFQKYNHLFKTNNYLEIEGNYKDRSLVVSVVNERNDL